MRFAIWALAVLMALGPGAGLSSATPTCLEDAVARYHDGKAAFQTGMAKLIASRSPQLARLAELNRDLQTALAERRQLQVLFLARTAPDRLITDEGISRLMNFDWTPDDQEAWRAADPAAPEIEARIAELENETRDHPDWSALRELVRSNLSKSREFGALTSALAAATTESETALAGCS